MRLSRSTRILRCRLRRRIGDEIIELDAHLCSAQTWRALCEAEPSYRRWSTAPIAGCILALEPIPLRQVVDAIFGRDPHDATS